jgi:threonylcarbamoyladenosine tRNA methylthiotransferase MtaB
VFKYSRRDGTRAASMPAQIDEHIKTARSNELINMSKLHSAEFIRYYIGKKVEVLFEEEKELKLSGAEGKYHIGHTRDYIKVVIPAKDGIEMSNVTAQVSITGSTEGGMLMGEIRQQVL